MVLKYIIILFILTLTLLGYQGEGEGQSKQEAIYRALNHIASQISITVDSSTIVNKITTNEAYSREVQNMINVEIPKISFQHYHILEQSKRGKIYFVKLEIDSKALAETHIKRLKQKLNNLSQKIEAYSSKLKKYSLLKNANIKQFFLSLELIHAIDSVYDIGFYESQIENLNRDKNNYIKELTFQIKSDNSRVKEIANSAVNRHNFIVLSNGNIILKVNLGKVEKNQLDRQYIGTTRAIIKIEENQQRIFSKTIKLSATSFISEHYLFEEILKQLEEELNIAFKEILL